MKYLFRGGRRKVAAVMAIALVASLTQVAPSGAVSHEKPKYGGTLKVGVGTEFVGYCPGDILASGALMGARTIYESWVEQRADGRIVPFLLRSMNRSADSKTWKLTVRDGIRFHDGTPLDGAALVTNLQATRGVLTLQGRMRSPGTGGGILANIDNVVQTGPMEVTVTLWNAQSDFPETLYRAGRMLAIAPSQILNRATCSTVPIGTGPFKLVSTKLQELVVTKNTDYWRKAPNGDKLPYLDGITFTFLVETQPRVQGVRSGALDAALFTSADEAKQILDIQKVAKVTTILSPVDFYPSIWMNHKIAPFNSTNARLAFSHAMDREKFVKVRLKGLGGVPKSIVGPNNIMYNEKGYANFDLAKAKKFVAAYTAETGKALEFSMPYVAGSTESLAGAQMIKIFGAAAGMVINLVPMTTPEIVARSFTPGVGNQFQMVTIGVMEGTGSAYVLPFLVSDMSGGNPTHVLAKTPLRVLYSILNLSAFTDMVSENLLIAARGEANPVKQKALYRRATLQIQQQARLTNLGYSQLALTFGNKVQGVGVLPLAAGGARRLITNFGIDWTGVWKKG